MGGQKPTRCQIEAQLSHNGRHYFLETELELKGRGIAKDSRNCGDNMNHYRVTKLAYQKLQEMYAISYNLDSRKRDEVKLSTA